MAYLQLSYRVPELLQRSFVAGVNPSTAETWPELIELSRNGLLAALRDCSSREEVLQEVRRNYVDNLWWPLSVTDWRLRMLVAGWSTRVSYQHLSHYQKVVRNVSALGWEALWRMPDSEVVQCVASLGLPETRLLYLRSLTQFISARENRQEWLAGPNDELVEEFAREVQGAGFKVAQCAVLYAKGYECGIIPVDSGMVDMLSPLVPVRLPKSSLAHEIVRRWVEHLVKCASHQISAIAEGAGFPGLAEVGALTWWTHLVLIYYKRTYWNKGLQVGPFRREPVSSDSVVALSNKQHVPLRFKGVLLEGVDGVGKTTLAEALRQCGYGYIHSPYIRGDGVRERYLATLSTVNGPAVLDRTFLSEFVYGTVIRGYSRLSYDDCLELLGTLASKGFILLHLEEAEDTLAARCGGDLEERRRLIGAYRDLLASARNVIPIYRVEPSRLANSYLLEYLGISQA